MVDLCHKIARPATALALLRLSRVPAMDGSAGISNFGLNPLRTLMVILKSYNRASQLGGGAPGAVGVCVLRVYGAADANRAR
eukprot:2878232-Prymnesium_polylepis.1